MKLRFLRRPLRPGDHVRLHHRGRRPGTGSGAGEGPAGPPVARVPRNVARRPAGLRGDPGYVHGRRPRPDASLERGFGHSDLEKKIPATPTTIYSICSISKLFTSVAVLSLRDRGKLRLDDPLEKLLPWFSIKKTFPGFGPATMRGILTHSSGLPRESDFPYWTGPDFAFPTHDEIIARLKSQETLYPADLHYQYSNLGLTLAGEIVAQLSGRLYAEYVTETVLRPLKLADTQPRMPEEHRGGRLATGYSAMTREGKRNVLPFFQANGIAPAAGFSSTVEDLGRFASWQFRLLAKGGTEILDSNTLREMHRVQA